MLEAEKTGVLDLLKNMFLRKSHIRRRYKTAGLSAVLREG